jgi:hypothetical protein
LDSDLRSTQLGLLIFTKHNRSLSKFLRAQVNIPKTRRTYCKGRECHKHTQHKVTQYKAGKVRFHFDSTTGYETQTDFEFFSINIGLAVRPG